MDPKYIVNLSGRDYPLYAGVLAEAHERGLAAIQVALLQTPEEGNGWVAIAKATVTMQDGTTYEDYGDSSPKNVPPRLAGALIRMAITRAKGRALRDAVNIGQTLLEELPDMEPAGPHTPHARAREAVAAGERETMQSQVTRVEPAAPAVRREAPAPAVGEAPVCSNDACGHTLTQGQVQVSTRLYGQPLCPACQKEWSAAESGKVNGSA